MSLQGSLDMFALADVLRLLASTNKSGELQVKTRRSTGQLWLKDGLLTGGSVGEPMEIADVVFELLRSTEGSFSFAPDHEAAEPKAPEQVEFVIMEAERRLAEWREIEAVVPSISSSVRLIAEVDGPVSLGSEQWRIIAAIGSGTTVEELMRFLTQGEYLVSKQVKDFVEMGLVFVGAPDDKDPLFSEPETDVSSLITEAKQQSKSKDKEKAKAEYETPVLAAVPDEEPPSDAEALARWEEIRRLARIDEEGADEDEELSPEDQERAKELMAAEGADTVEDTPVNRGLLLKFLASAQTSA